MTLMTIPEREAMRRSADAMQNAADCITTLLAAGTIEGEDEACDAAAHAQELRTEAHGLRACASELSTEPTRRGVSHA